MNEKLLTIVIPTYNRGDILPYTLHLLREQVNRQSEFVEIVVCNNASTDNTHNEILKLYKAEPYFTYVHYQEHAEIGISISRSIDNVKSKYFLLWGDDDVPAPYMLDVLVDTLQKYPKIGCIHFNRLMGKDVNGRVLSNQKIFYSTYTDDVILYEDSQEFIKSHFRGMTFLSVDLIATEAWNKGKEIFTNEHLGFEYLAPFLYGINNYHCIYISFPLCIQRCLSKPIYDYKWPAYLYVGIPRLLCLLQQKHVINDWREIYNIYLTNGQFSSNILGYINNMIYRASRDKKYYKPLIKEIISYQESRIKKICTYLIILPSWMNKINRKIIEILIRIFKIN